MLILGQIKITKTIENIIKTKVSFTEAPYIFKIKGTPGGGHNTETSALKAFDKLKIWADKNFAEMKILENNYTYQGTKRHEYLLVKITDPVAFPIERILEGDNK